MDMWVILNKEGKIVGMANDREFAWRNAYNTITNSFITEPISQLSKDTLISQGCTEKFQKHIETPLV